MLYRRYTRYIFSFLNEACDFGSVCADFTESHLTEICTRTAINKSCKRVGGLSRTTSLEIQCSSSFAAKKMTRNLLARKMAAGKKRVDHVAWQIEVVTNEEWEELVKLQGLIGNSLYKQIKLV